MTSFPIFTKYLFEKEKIRKQFFKENNLEYQSIITDLELSKKLCDYRNEHLEKLPKEYWEEAVDECVDFKVEFKRSTRKYFGEYGKFYESACVGKFYQNDVLIFERMISGNNIVLYGDGKNRNKTYFTTCEENNIVVYDLNQEKIKKMDLAFCGFLSQQGLRKVNADYMISNTLEYCTHVKFVDFIEMREFFNPEIEECKRICLISSQDIEQAEDDEDLISSIFPVEVTPEGFIIQDILCPEKELPILHYDKVMNFKFVTWKDD